MKIKSDMWQVTGDKRVRALSGKIFAPRRSRQGMALVITLIMLSVTLIMAIAFLAISRRERISVGTSTDTTVARFATDTGLAAAESQILANIYSTNTAIYNYSLLVSTNYINPFGYVIGSQSPTNVNYDYRSDGQGLNGADFDQNVANLQILPRAPVMISASETNGRFYLDLNRNGAFEDTGNLPFSVGEDGSVLNAVFPGAIGDPQWVGVLERPGLPHSADNKFISRYAFIALPVGESLDLNYIHNQAFTATLNSIQDGFFRNQGVGSWEINLAAFFADLNTNEWYTASAPYQYNRPLSGSFVNTGNAFFDAFSLLAWRYNFNYNNLAVAGQNFFLSAPPNIFGRDNIDIYADGPLQLTTTNINENFSSPSDSDKNTATIPWAGSENPNHFYTPSDLFQTNKTFATAFANRLVDAGTNMTASGLHPTYDRYTFYRMLDQLGTDTLPDDIGKLNLNYKNASLTYDSAGILFLNSTIVPGMETNLLPWNPRDFFCAAADQMLKVYTTNWFQAGPSNYLATYYGTNYFGPVDRYTGFGLTNVPVFGITNQIPAFGLTNIPVQVNGNFVYSPAVNRLLQLAANIFDAGTNDFYPHVFRPDFNVVIENGFRNTYINGYEEVSSLNGLSALTISSSTPPLDQPVDLSFLPLGVTSDLHKLHGNVYGIPWIIGAKKFMPNFNQFYAFNTAQVTRKLQLNRTAATLTTGWSGASKQLYSTNQMINLSITNHIGFSFWNSYTANYPGLQPYIYAQDFITMRLSYGSYTYTAFTNFTFQNIQNPWAGSAWTATSPPRTFNNPASFVAGLFEFPFVHEAALDLDQNGNLQGTGFKAETFVGAPTTLPAFPDFEEDTTNRFQAVILDSGHVLDYVQFYGPVQVRTLGDDVRDPNVASPGLSMWATNTTTGSGVNWGVQNQIATSQNGGAGLPASTWQSPPNMPPGLQGIKAAEGAMFKGFFSASWNYNSQSYNNTNLVQQAPYTPTRTVVSPTLWVANDPLVHYLSSDLAQTVNELAGVTNGVAHSDNPASPPVAYPNLGNIPPRYQPWGLDKEMDGLVSVLHDSYNLAYRDPLVWGSDNWDFPTNKYPSVGWLGRVHRGTPWQTVYLKATDLVDPNVPNLINQATWYNWTGDFNGFDAANSRPVQDELLFDIFTAAPNASASRGTLSVNQKHPAAWSAVLGGMVVLTNITGSPQYSSPPVYTNLISNPAGLDLVDAPLWQIINGTNGINNIRSILYPNSGFLRAGDILRVPALSEQSPFLNRADASHIDYDIGDEAYEWLPQQMMGLVRSTGQPRYVIYTYGQTLKPAPDGTVLSGGQYFGLVTNYQVVAESATRAVMTVQQVLTNTVINGVTVPATNYNMKVESFNVLPPD